MEGLFDVLIAGTGLDHLSFALMCAVSLIGGFITASLGLGGGMLVMVTMASLLPPTVLIPLHGVVQLGSNAGRALVLRPHILWPLVPPFLIGTVFGAALGGNLVLTLPTAVLQTILGAFILYTTWGPKFRTTRPGPKSLFGIGFAGALATMFVGATGPLVAPFAAASSEKRHEVVAMHATFMTMQHTLKIIAFGMLGFAFGPYIPLLVGLLTFGFVGTYIGKHMLNFMPERIFRILLKTVLTVLSLRVLYTGIRDLVVG